MTAKKTSSKPKKITPIWLDRSAMPPLPFYTLVTSYEMYVAALKKLKAPPDDASFFYGGIANATKHYSEDNEPVYFVSVNLLRFKDKSLINIYATLVHEAMHILQWYYESHGEESPACENQAYLIEHISKELFTEYSRQTNEQKPNRKTKNA